MTDDVSSQLAALRAENDQLRARTALLMTRTASLGRVISELSKAVRSADVARIVVDAGTQVLHAASAALWGLSEDGSSLLISAAHNYPPAALELVRVMPVHGGTPVADAAIRGEPVWLTSRADYAERYPASAARTQAMAPSEYATACLPVRLDDKLLGVLALTFIEQRDFDDDERSFLTFLVSQCAHGFDRARLYEAELEARRIAEIAQARAAFLARASEVLGSSLDYEQTLTNVADLAVPGIADWCGVELGERAEEARQVAVAHVDPEKVELARKLREKYPTPPDAPTGVPQVLRTGTSEIYPEIPQELLTAGAQDEEHLRVILELGLVSAMIVPIKDRGRTVGAISFVIAHSPRRYTADDVVMAEQLAERAGVAIANAKLYDEAIKAVQLRDEFLLVAGHELRTPLAAMSLHHESLLAAKPDTQIAKVRERAGKLVEQSNRLAKLIEELLDVSRISAGKLTLDRVELDLAALVTSCTERMREDLLRARCELEVQLAPATGHWDRSRLDQVITNLISNALKYGKGHPIEVSVARVDDAAVLTVRDRGIGIAVEDQARIFERYERAVSVRNFGGLGLGLWIVRRLVEAHGGSISVDSLPGHGATFVVRLPLK